MQLLDVVGRFLLYNGVGQNVTAAGILSVPTIVWARVRLLPVWREHHQRVREIHAALVPKEGTDGSTTRR